LNLTCSMAVNPRGLDDCGTVEQSLELPTKGWFDSAVDWVVGTINKWTSPAEEPASVDANRIIDEPAGFRACHICEERIPEDQPRYRLYSGNPNPFCKNCAAKVREQRDRQRQQFGSVLQSSNKYKDKDQDKDKHKDKYQDKDKNKNKDKDKDKDKDNPDGRTDDDKDKARTRTWY